MTAAVLTGPFWVLGCGMAAAPQPPSLHLPQPVKDLAATRAGTQVVLRWTSPKETTDKLKLKAPIHFRICRAVGTAPCQNLATLDAPPGKPASYTAQLAAADSSGQLRRATYRLFGVNKHGKSAGPSNAAAVLMGAVPPAVEGLTASRIERGVVLHWQPVSGLPRDTHIHLRRTLATKPADAAKKSALPSAPAPAQQMLSVAVPADGKDSGAALDDTVQFDQTYRYVASRVVSMHIGKEVLRAASSPSQPTTITTRDTFPPRAPVGLAAVPVSAEINGGKPEVDLSWSPNTEPDVAQYRVYRRDVTANGSVVAASKQRIAPENATGPVVSPAFRDTHVLPGHTYAYCITAVDNAGNESVESKTVDAMVPTT
ncbi:MAG: fibronectin type III domain-containing protein [Acidobacteriaceae bacterium]